MRPAVWQDCHGFKGHGIEGSGYRISLALALSEPPCGGCGLLGGGYNISTMGTLSTGPSYTPLQWHRHEGHPGWQINAVDEILNQSLATSPKPPDLITIHLGTNDCDGDVPVSTMVDRMGSLLEHIAVAAPKASVFLADVIGTGAPEGFNDCIKSFNAQVPGLVDRMAGKVVPKLYFVPMYNETGICGAPMSGEDHALCGGHQIHPTAAGYLRMASAFARVILQNLEL